jgi:acetolactate decarboxylase
MTWRDVLLAGGVIVTCCSPALNGQEPAARTISLNETLIQYSLIASLAAGDYGGGTPLSQVLKEGDFGVGTFDHLEGEMILLDGTIYQALADGTIHKPELTRSTPFAVTTTFDADGQFEDFNALSLEDLDDRLNKQLPRGNSAYAIRIDGEFAALSLRSVKAQTPPYRPLVDVVKDQSVFHHKMVKGTMFGFRCPQWVGTLNVPGYHWHFISDDRTIGGHVISCVFQGTKVEYDQCTSLLIRIPESEMFDDFDINSVKPKDIDVIERQSHPKP